MATATISVDLSQRAHTSSRRTWGLPIKALITGGSGYLGTLLIPALQREGYDCVSVDVRESPASLDNGVDFLQADLADPAVLERFDKRAGFDVIFHLASQIDFATRSQVGLLHNNVWCTENVAQLAKFLGVPKVIFTSSNSIYLGIGNRNPVRESDEPQPTDAYGRSKVRSEEILRASSDHFDTVSIRCPNIVDASRVGLLSILFEFVREGRKCWVIDNGCVRHQCIYAPDLISACMRSVSFPGSNTFNIGSDGVPSFADLYQYIIDRAGTAAVVASVPRWVAMPAMRAARRLHLLPFGDYQFRMLTEDFVFDTTKIKNELHWAPTLTNGEMFYRAYAYYVAHRDEILQDADLSANRQAATMGVVGVLKWLS